MAILYFYDVLRKVGINPEKVMLIRHALTDKRFKECYDNGKVFEYTCHQKKGFGKGYEYWAVFISGTSTYAKLFALYRVGAFVADTPNLVPTGLPKCEAKEYRGENVLFHLTPVSLLSEYEGKLTIDWGKSTRMWHQKGTSEKPIISLQMDKKKEFSGYENMILSYDELKEIVTNQEVYDVWRDALASVYAIYLIVDKESGQQYVGSAYGEGGLLARWKCYIDTYHGNNKKMKELLTIYPERYHHFQFSVLQILPKTVSENDVIRIEALYKKKLLSTQFGMNEN